MSETPGIDVRKVAGLARLRLTPAEEAEYGAQLERILGYVTQLNEVDVSGVDLTLIADGFTRPDEDRPSQDAESALRNAPRRSGDQFLVPKVVE